MTSRKGTGFSDDGFNDDGFGDDGFSDDGFGCALVSSSDSGLVADGEVDEGAVDDVRTGGESAFSADFGFGPLIRRAL